MKRFTVMGFTEAELGFVLAALFAAVAAARMAEAAAREEQVATLEAAAVQRDSLSSEYEQYRDSVRVVLADMQARLAAAEKKSTKVPQCWEMGRQREPVAVLGVVGRNAFLLDGQRLDLAGVLARLEHRVATGDSLGCRFVVRAPPAAGVSGSDHSAAVWTLRRYFDVDDRPS